jgi:hypothetical protein
LLAASLGLPAVIKDGLRVQTEEQRNREINAAAQAVMAVRMHYKVGAMK